MGETLHAPFAFLTQEEVEYLTGAKVMKLQAEFLRAKGIKFIINRRNQVIVRRDYDRGKAPTGEFELGEVR